MKRGIVVFLGPSLDRAEAEAILAAGYRPPAARGDLAAAAASGARIIALIDGVFFQDCAVGHREILEALRSGVRVVGASSMGALRAAELDTLGMEGVGVVYALYRDGTLVADDEVALVYEPGTYAHLSEPLVNIRCTLEAAVRDRVVSPGEAAALLSAARSLYFPDRTYPRVCEEAAGLLPEGTIRDFLAYARTQAVDQKEEDARACLVRVREIAGEMGLIQYGG
jgi:hypothetical protein